jgi:hypothetical protein
MRLDPTEAAEYYFKYINLVEGDDVTSVLEEQRTEFTRLLETISEEGSHHRYAPGKWTIGQVLGHVNDCERLFMFRAFWFARRLEAPLPSFDQDAAAQFDGAAERSWKSLVDEFQAVRASTLSLFRNLPPDAWLRRGTASGYEFSVRALAYIAAGHVTHHAHILKDRYLGRAGATRD